MTRRIFRIWHHVEHPGRLILDVYLPSIGIHDKQGVTLAHLLQMDLKYVQRMLNGKESINEAASFELARVFRTTPRFWLLLQEIYNESAPIQNTEERTTTTSTDRESIPGIEEGGQVSERDLRARRV